MDPNTVSGPAHVVTDASGRIETISRGARALLRGRGAECGRSLLECFPEHRKALVFDIDVARTGWPTERTLKADWTGVAVRYRVSRLLVSGGLYWEFRVADSPLRRCA